MVDTHGLIKHNFHLDRHKFCFNTEKNKYLKVDHLPETGQVRAMGLLLPEARLAAVHQPGELLEPLGNQKLGLANGATDLTGHCVSRTEIG